MTDEEPTEPLPIHDEHLDNPVGRLWLFLKYLWTVNAQTQVGVAWSNYLSIPTGEPLRYLPAWTRLAELPDLAEAAINEAGFAPRKAGDYILSVRRSRDIFAHAANAATPVTSATASYGESDLKVLEICSGELIDLGSYGRLTTDLLSGLKESAQELIEEITRSETSSDFIVFLVRMMRRVIDEIDSYAAGGWEPIAEEWERLNGRAKLTPDWLEQLKRVPAATRKFAVVVFAITQLLSAGQEAVQEDLKTIDSIVQDVNALVNSFPNVAKEILPAEPRTHDTDSATADDDRRP